MQQQIIPVHYNTGKIEKPSTLSRASITIVIALFFITFLSSCAVWVRTPYDHDNGRGRHGNNGHGRGGEGHDRH